MVLFVRQNWKGTWDNHTIRLKNQQWWQALAQRLSFRLLTVFVAIMCTITYGMQLYVKHYCVEGKLVTKNTGMHLQ